MARKRIQSETEKAVLILCRRRCCVCYGLERDVGIKRGQIAHLDGNPSNNELNNLVFLCLVHHDQYDSRTSQSKGLTPHEIEYFRDELHKVIGRHWKQPSMVAEIADLRPDNISGHYVRESQHESAELEVSLLDENRVRVTGLALWGTTRKYGPNIGELDFEAPIERGLVQFRDQTWKGEEYLLELTFENERLVAGEHCSGSYFGLNVSFGGEYQRVYRRARTT